MSYQALDHNLSANSGPKDSNIRDSLILRTLVEFAENQKKLELLVDCVEQVSVSLLGMESQEAGLGEGSKLVAASGLVPELVQEVSRAIRLTERLKKAVIRLQTI